jgi:DNA ligase 1
MKRFAQLIEELDQTNKTNTKVNSLTRYFKEAPDDDRIWALALFTHRRPRRQISSSFLRNWAAEMANVPLWLLEESYHVVGDLAEAISLALPQPRKESDYQLSEWIHYIMSLSDLEDAKKKEAIITAWQQLEQFECFIFIKLITGGFRVGVSQRLVTRALAEVFSLEQAVVAHRIMGSWKPGTTDFHSLLLKEDQSDQYSRPYPFYLAYPVTTEEIEKELGEPDQWVSEWKWDGIRSQFIKRNNEFYVWSRGEELVTEKFPEFDELGVALPNGTVLDGEIIPYRDGMPLPFARLQTRIGRKNLTKKILEDAPVMLKAYDLVEWNYIDWRDHDLLTRREKLQELVNQLESYPVRLSETVNFSSWKELGELKDDSRHYGAEGFMIKKKHSTYQVGRKKGDWWKWKVDPMTMDAVLINAQRGSGRRAGLYTDFTFAVINTREDDDAELIPFAKAYSGLTDKEMKSVDQFVKKNTLEKFGPVRSVKPKLVFEIGFEGIQYSRRHKSGVAVRFPRILRWRQDKPVDEINTLDDLHELLGQFG